MKTISVQNAVAMIPAEGHPDDRRIHGRWNAGAAD